MGVAAASTTGTVMGAREPESTAAVASGGERHTGVQRWQPLANSKIRQTRILIEEGA